MNGTWRVVFLNSIERTYLLRVDVTNVADHIHVDTHDPDSRGYGGSICDFKTREGGIYQVKGPWHTNSAALLKETGIDLTHLHLTRVMMWSTKWDVLYFDDYVTQQESGRKVWTPQVAHDRLVAHEIIYEEKEPALGTFMRGELIAHAYVKATGESVMIQRESNGGSSKHIVTPDTKMHPMAREGLTVVVDSLSAMQAEIIGG